MSDPTGLRRRRLLATAAGLAVTGSLAGCTESDDPATTGDSGTDDSGVNGTDSGTNGNETSDGSDTGASADDLDLREANVVGVAFEGESENYDFSVTLHHDDDGEDGYANWWQVERLDGTQLGRRELAHAHARQPFTRSERIEIPDDVSCVVVRGHDQTHGYGGRAVTVSLASGEMRAVDQGRDRQSIDGCPPE